jgi:putative ABC transport system permease protein
MRPQLTETRLALGGARSIRSGLVALGIVVLVLSAALVSWPRTTNGILTSDLRYRMALASAPTRDLRSSIDLGTASVSSLEVQSQRSLDTLWKSMPAALGRIRARMPASVRAITQPGLYVGRDGGAGGRGVPSTGPPHTPAGTSYLIALEANPRLRSDAVLVDGKWPGSAKNFNGSAPLEVVIAAKAATLLQWTIGQTRTLGNPGKDSEVVKLVGTVKPRDETSDYWQLDRTRAQAGSQPSIDADRTVYNGLVWFDAGSWQQVGNLFAGQSIVSWFPVGAQALTESNVSPTIADLQRFLSVPQRVGSSSTTVVARYSTNLPSVSSDFLERASPVSAVLSVVGTGPLGTGCAVVLLGVVLLIDRRRPVLALIRARGASERQLRTTVCGETALATVPGAIVGGAIAAWLTPGPVDLLLIATIVACALLPVAAALARVETTRGRVATRRATARGSVRWVAEIVVLLLAALSATLLLQRGITPDSTTVGIDPLLTLTPILIVAVVCLTLLRGYPVVFQWAGRFLRPGRGVVGYVGWANAGRTPVRFLSIFAVVAGISLTIFSFTILSTERSGIEVAELQKVGADISASGAPLPSDSAKRLAQLSGVIRVVPIEAAGGITLTGDPSAIALFTVDAKQLAAVQAGIPPSLRQFDDLGTRSHGHTTVIAGGFEQEPPPVAYIDGLPRIPIHVVPLRGLAPTFVSAPPWILMDRAALPKGSSFSHVPLSVLLQLRPGAETPATLAAIRNIVGPAALVDDTAELVHASKTAPVVSGFEQLTTAALGFSALMCVLALTLTLLLNTPARIRLLGRLRALGFARRQRSGLVAWELGPLAVLGVVAGLVVGLVLPLLLVGPLNLAGLTGSVTDPMIILDPLTILAVVVGFGAAATLATVIAIVGARRAAYATVLRNSGED